MVGRRSRTSTVSHNPLSVPELSLVTPLMLHLRSTSSSSSSCGEKKCIKVEKMHEKNAINEEKEESIKVCWSVDDVQPASGVQWSDCCCR